MVEATDQALIQRVATLNCHDSCDVLVRRHQAALRYSLRQMTGWDQSLADDLAQETFIKAYRAIGSFQGNAKFSSWLYRIGYNLLVSHFRIARNRELTAGDDLTNSTAPITRFTSNDLHKDLAHALLRLPAQQRMALHLHLHKQLTHQEICNIMEIPLGTVKTAIRRGKETLQEELSSWKDGDML